MTLTPILSHAITHAQYFFPTRCSCFHPFPRRRTAAISCCTSRSQMKNRRRSSLASTATTKRMRRCLSSWRKSEYNDTVRFILKEKSEGGLRGVACERTQRCTIVRLSVLLDLYLLVVRCASSHEGHILSLFMLFTPSSPLSVFIPRLWF